MPEIAAPEKLKYLIIGNSAGGIGAAEAIRQVDWTGSIAIVSDEPFSAYSRPLISKHLADRRPIEKMLFRPADFYEQNSIQTLLGTRVQRLSPGEHSIEIEDGKKLYWEKALLATGGSPIIPKMEGLEREGVFTFVTLGDAQAIDHFLGKFPDRSVKAVVIGGGLIGVSITEALVKRGVQVTVVEMRDWVLNTMLDRDTASVMAERLNQAGVEIITGRTVARIDSYLTGVATGVTLDDGQSLPAELVIVAIGVRPRTDLAIGTGIKINRGIVVDRHMATSVPDIYACGDVAEAYDAVYGENRVIPIWPNTYVGGRVAGFNMAGVPTEYAGGTAMNSLNYFGLDIVSAGMFMPPGDGYEVLTSRYDHIHRRIILKNERIVGLVFVGNVERSGIVRNLMQEGTDVSRFKTALLAEDLNLAMLPREIWEPHLAAPLVATDTGRKPEEVAAAK